MCGRSHANANANGSGCKTCLMALNAGGHSECNFKCNDSLGSHIGTMAEAEMATTVHVNFSNVIPTNLWQF